MEGGFEVHRVQLSKEGGPDYLLKLKQARVNSYPANIYILKMPAFSVYCISFYFHHGSKQYEPGSDCSRGSSLIWVHTYL